MAATIKDRITQLEQRLIERPLTYAVQDSILNRLAALEDCLLAPDDQPTADQLSTVVLRAEHDSWQRVNPGADVVEWTIHFARTRGLGL